MASICCDYTSTSGHSRRVRLAALKAVTRSTGVPHRLTGGGESLGAEPKKCKYKNSLIMKMKKFPEIFRKGVLKFENFTKLLITRSSDYPCHC